MKSRQNKGFTLAELLVVVAIIAVLVAVSIPIFTAQLTKAKASTDMANVRSAKAAASAQYLSDTPTGGAVYYYDAESGTVSTDADAAKSFAGYGKSTTDLKDDKASGIPLDQIVQVTFSADGTHSCAWVLGSDNAEATDTPGAISILDIEGKQWSTLAADGQYGVKVSYRTVVSEGDQKYLFYTHTDYYSGDHRNTVLATSYNSGVFAGNVEKLTADTKIYATPEDCFNEFNGKTVPAGTIVQTGDSYIVLAQAYTMNKWNKPVANTGNWVAVK